MDGNCGRAYMGGCRLRKLSRRDSIMQSSLGSGIFRPLWEESSLGFFVRESISGERFPATDMNVWNLVESRGNRPTPPMFSAWSTWHASLVRTFEGRFRGFQDVPDRLVRSVFSHLPQHSHISLHPIIPSDPLKSSQIRQLFVLDFTFIYRQIPKGF